MLGIPDAFVLLSGATGASLEKAFAAVSHSGVDLPVVVIDVAEGQDASVIDYASAAGIAEGRMNVHPRLDVADRAAVFSAAAAFIAGGDSADYPWRVIDALAIGTPVVAAASDVLHEVIVDGGLLVEDDADALGAGLMAALATDAARERLSVLSADRGRAFSWDGAAERVWHLHAEL